MASKKPGKDVDETDEQRVGQMNRMEQYELLFRARNIEIYWHPVHQFLYANWIGVQYEAELRLAGEKMLELLIKKETDTVLNDNSRVIGPWVHSADWAREDWFHRMKLAGLKIFAWVCPDDMFSHLSAKRALPGGDAVNIFPTYEEAFLWLTQTRK